MWRFRCVRLILTAKAKRTWWSDCQWCPALLTCAVVLRHALPVLHKDVHMHTKVKMHTFAYWTWHVLVHEHGQSCLAAQNACKYHACALLLSHDLCVYFTHRLLQAYVQLWICLVTPDCLQLPYYHCFHFLNVTCKVKTKLLAAFFISIHIFEVFQKASILHFNHTISPSSILQFETDNFMRTVVVLNHRSIWPAHLPFKWTVFLSHL